MQRTKLLLLVVVLVIVSCSVAAGQTGSVVAGQTGNIKGKVLNRADKKPIINATVRIQGTPRSTRSDKDGEYSFEQLNAGQDYILDISKSPLYEDGQTTVNVQANVTAAAADVALLRLPSNTPSLQNLVKDFSSLLTLGDIDTLETRLENITMLCKGEGDEFCKDIVAMEKAVENKKLGVAGHKLDKIRTNVGMGE